jgi:hypothetical protein
MYVCMQCIKNIVAQELLNGSHLDHDLADALFTLALRAGCPKRENRSNISLPMVSSFVPIQIKWRCSDTCLRFHAWMVNSLWGCDPNIIFATEVQRIIDEHKSYWPYQCNPLPGLWTHLLEVTTRSAWEDWWEIACHDSQRNNLSYSRAHSISSDSTTTPHTMLLAFLHHHQMASTVAITLII